MNNDWWKDNEDAGDMHAFNAADYSGHLHEERIEMAADELHHNEKTWAANGSLSIYEDADDALSDLRIDGHDIYEEDMDEIMAALKRLREIAA